MALASRIPSVSLLVMHMTVLIVCFHSLSLLAASHCHSRGDWFSGFQRRFMLSWVMSEIHKGKDFEWLDVLLGNSPIIWQVIVFRRRLYHRMKCFTAEMTVEMNASFLEQLRNWGFTFLLWDITGYQLETEPSINGFSVELNTQRFQPTRCIFSNPGNGTSNSIFSEWESRKSSYLYLLLCHMLQFLRRKCSLAWEHFNWFPQSSLTSLC